ncbi:MAG: FAD-dependent oxidoreductase [gamma proteobacterium symbiont of Bathyaustriella thionipta]|nr:FAD-dependent oxidoreductase [gamma proteobacterium symbiont of Bathyaustriella thionipta]MCU7951462.1 FAD-dependent oxidoreductase [gamma proteobacterium symbiont of Bathyaustriella thionipta]MCU7952305.1 FAD-dependent oxidoreductase [gamma proteobacterium symbiont of Bathyaustriella thionipta]MCU7958025.1 FAD-dependent oxidoreductase [gamma proteobacterium symbiont of Bathyaustriella thionipta]MCU7967020.1 FAD-dependent oxidoreductase [gamma proteobacterium symbiont of Bathyaustriella thio
MSLKKLSRQKLIILVLIILAVIAFFTFDISHYFSFSYLKENQLQFNDYFQAHPFSVSISFFIIYIISVAFSVPGATLLTLIGGAVFGFIWGLVLISFASSIGATLAFLVSRFLLRDSIQNRFGSHLERINRGIEKEGAFYLFTLRLVPVFPFFLVNLVMGLTPIKTRTYYWVSQLGMLAGTAVYVNAGTQLGQLESTSGILSLPLIISFTLLGIFPFIAKNIITTLQANQVYKGINKPKIFDRNLVVIGAGAAGLVTSYIAATVKAKVTLIEKHKMGGDCLNTGCVPSKALIRSAKFKSHISRAKEFGFEETSANFDFKEIMLRIKRVICQVEPHDSVERYTSLGVECLQGKATIISPFSVEVNGRILTTRNIVVATGARPFVPSLEGIDQVGYLTSDNLWEMQALPERFMILGGGPIGCELAQSFARLGSQVILLDRNDRIMKREDPHVSEMVQTRFLQEGVDLRLRHQAQRFEVIDGNKRLICNNEQGEEIAIVFDELLIALGRKANVNGFGLENLDMPLTKQGTIEVNEYLQTKYPNIYACGDVAGPYQFTHTAAHQAWYASVNSLFRGFKAFRADYSVIPWATFTDPEVARVGLNELEANEQNVRYEVSQFDIDDLDRAIADEEAHGFIKVLTVPGKDKILGVTIVGEHAGDLIAEYVMAMRHGIGLNKILSTIHIYPTLAEANKYVAGQWKQAHKPEKILSWLEKFHHWRRR